MKFKNTLNVFVDNFSVVYRHLLYRLVITLITFGLYSAVIYPFANAILSSSGYQQLISGVKEFINNLLEGRAAELGDTTEKIRTAINSIVTMVSTNSGNIIWGVVGVLAVYIIKKFLMGIGNYATSAVICDKMALRAKSPYILTLVRNLKTAVIYNLIYVPLAVVYEIVACIGMYFLIFWGFKFIHNLPVQLFMYSTAVSLHCHLKWCSQPTGYPPLFVAK
jgi:hypothetical protein